jgi:hypothetical protein
LSEDDQTPTLLLNGDGVSMWLRASGISTLAADGGGRPAVRGLVRRLLRIVEMRSAGMRVEVREPEQMNLLGLILASVLRRRLEDERARRHAARIAGDVVVDAAGMRVTLQFARDAVEVVRGASDGAVVVLRGSLTGLIDAALRRRRLQHVVRGELSVHGKPRAIMHLLGLLRVEAHP